MQQPTKPQWRYEKSWRTLLAISSALFVTFLSVAVALTLQEPNTKPTPPNPASLPIIIAIMLVLACLIGITAYLVNRSEHSRQSPRTLLYSERMSVLTKSLTKSSADIDRILQEMTQIVQEREKAISTLEQKQTRLQTEVESLEKGPAEAVKLFTEYLERQDKKGRKRDFTLFALGAFISLLSTILGLLLTGSIHLLGH